MSSYHWKPHSFYFQQTKETQNMLLLLLPFISQAQLSEHDWRLPNLPGPAPQCCNLWQEISGEFLSRELCRARDSNHLPLPLGHDAWYAFSFWLLPWPFSIQIYVILMEFPSFPFPAPPSNPQSCGELIFYSNTEWNLNLVWYSNRTGWNRDVIPMSSLLQCD